MKSKPKPAVKIAAKPAPVIEPDEVDEIEEVEPESTPEPEASPEPAAHTALDETVPGGRYLVNGIMVNADGEPI